MRKEIENFAIWYFLAIAPMYIISFQLFFSETGAISYGHRTDMILRVLPNIVCGGWLFFATKGKGLNVCIWTLFGFVAELFVVVLYFINKAYNQNANKPDGSAAD